VDGVPGWKGRRPGFEAQAKDVFLAGKNFLIIVFLKTNGIRVPNRHIFKMKNSVQLNFTGSKT